MLGDQEPNAASAVQYFHLILTMTPRGSALIVPRIADGNIGAQRVIGNLSRIPGLQSGRARIRTQTWDPGAFVYSPMLTASRPWDLSPFYR